MKKYDIDFDNLSDHFSDDYDDTDFFFPMANQVASKVVAHDLVPVQPLSAPSILIYRDFTYEEIESDSKKIDETK